MSFEAFWATWPANRQGGYSRKGAKSECLKRWNKHHHDTHAPPERLPRQRLDDHESESGWQELSQVLWEGSETWLKK